METGIATLTVEFEIEATSLRDAEKWLDGALRAQEDDDALVRYEVVGTRWDTILVRPTAEIAEALAALRQSGTNEDAR